jgi:hypothetical protein
MMPRYTVEYATQFKKHSQGQHYASDDPVACEEFLAELLERGFQIKTIRHEGLEVSKQDFDKMIKTAAGMLAARSICASLGISTEEEHHRFGFTA